MLPDCNKIRNVLTTWVPTAEFLQDNSDIADTIRGQIIPSIRSGFAKLLAKSQSIPGFDPEVALENAIAQTVAEYISNHVRFIGLSIELTGAERPGVAPKTDDELIAWLVKLYSEC